MKKELRDEMLDKLMFEEFNTQEIKGVTESEILTKSKSGFSIKDIEDMASKLKDTILLCNPQDEAIIREVVNKSDCSHRIEIITSNIFQKGLLYIMKKEDMEYKNHLYMVTENCQRLKRNNLE